MEGYKTRAGRGRRGRRGLCKYIPPVPFLSEFTPKKLVNKVFQHFFYLYELPDEAKLFAFFQGVIAELSNVSLHIQPLIFSIEDILK
jgi:hypothetical protein